VKIKNQDTVKQIKRTNVQKRLMKWVQDFSISVRKSARKVAQTNL